MIRTAAIVLGVALFFPGIVGLAFGHYRDLFTDWLHRYDPDPECSHTKVFDGSIDPKRDREVDPWRTRWATIRETKGIPS